MEERARTAGKPAVAGGPPLPVAVVAGPSAVAEDRWENTAVTRAAVRGPSWALRAGSGPCRRGLVLLAWLGKGTGRGTAGSRTIDFFIKIKA